MADTRAWLRVKADIDQYQANPIDDVDRATALRSNLKGKRMARKKTRKKKTSPRKKKKTSSRSRPRKKTTRRAKRKKTSRKKATRRTMTTRRSTTSRKRRGRTTTYRTKRTTTVRRKNPVRAAAATPAAPRSVTRTQVVRVQVEPRRSNPTKKRRTSTKKRRRRNPTRTQVQPPMHHNPPVQEGGLGGLFQNPDGPFTGENLKGYGLAVLGVGFGLVAADFVDRYVATRTPDDSVAPAMEAQRPWYGRDAAAAQQRRPDAWRLAAQAGGVVGSMALAFFTRDMRVLPWLLSGTAVGFGSTLFMKLVNWWAMPAVFSVDDPTEESFSNRMYPLEQDDVQSEVDTLFENWANVPSLAEAQAPELGAGSIQSPLAGATGVYALGKAGSGNGQPQPLSLSDQPVSDRPGFVRTGTLGKCGSCGGQGGCWGNCKDYTGFVTAECDCPKNGDVIDGPQCWYVVKENDNFQAIVSATNADVGMINALNGGRAPSDYWRVGARVRLPFAVCRYVHIRDGQPPVMPPMEPPGGGGGVSPPPQQPPGGGGGVNPPPAQPPGGGGGGVSPPVEQPPEGGGGGVPLTPEDTAVPPTVLPPATTHFTPDEPYGGIRTVRGSEFAPFGVGAPESDTPSDEAPFSLLNDD